VSKRMSIQSASRRSLSAALHKARLHLMTEPNSIERQIEVGSHLLTLLVAGIDSKETGTQAWRDMILNTAMSEDAAHAQEQTRPDR